MSIPLDEKRARRRLGLAFCLVAASLMSIGGLHFRQYEKHYRLEVERTLSAIAELKVSELVQYRNERLGDGVLLHRNASISALVRRFLGNADLGAQRELLSWMAKFQANYQYDQVRLLDTQGVSRLVVPSQAEPAPAILTQRVPEILRLDQVALQDFYRDERDQKVYLALTVPITDEANGSQPLGVLVLRIDPAANLYRSIRAWPTASLTAETLLVRREGTNALFLNELRFATNTTLNRRVPLANQEVPAARAALGHEGTMEGVDYRGKPVLAYLRIVPGSPWFLVARMDKAEVDAPLRERLWMLIATVLALLIGSGAGLTWLWWQQSARFYRKEYETTQALRESEEQLRLVLDQSNDAIFWAVADTGIIARCNRRTEQITERTRDQLVGMHVEELHPPGRDYRTIFRQLASVPSTENIEAELLSRTGKRTPVVVNFSVVAVGGTRIVQGICRDVTEQRQTTEALRLALQESKQSQAEVVALLKGARSLLEHRQLKPTAQAIYQACKELIGSRAGYVALQGENSEDVDGLFLDAGGEFSGFDPAAPPQGLPAAVCHTRRVTFENDLRAGGSVRLLPPGQTSPENVLSAPLVLQDRVAGVLCFANKPGGFTAADARLAQAFAELAALALQNSRNVQLLEDSEERFRLVAHSAEDAIVTADVRGTVVFWNPAAERIFGYPEAEMLGQSILRLVPDPLRAQGHRAFQQAMAQGTLKTLHRPLETTGHRRDGSEVALEVTVALWKNGPRLFCTAIIREITRRKQTEAALQTASEQRRLALEAAGMGAWDYRFDTGKVFCDERSRAQWGIAQGEEVDYATAVAAIHPNDRAAVEEEVKRALAGAHGGVFHREFGVLWPDGSVRWIESRGRVYFEGEGDARRPVRFIGANREITERKAEEETRDFLSRCGFEGSHERFFQALARYLATSLRVEMVSIDRLLEEGSSARNVVRYLDGKFEANVECSLQDGPCGQVVAHSTCCFPKGVRKLFPKDAILQELQAESYVGTTLWGLDGKPIGLIGLAGRRPLADPGLTETMLKLVAVRAAGELHRTQVEEELRRAHEGLELRVQERTAELRKLNDRLFREIDERRQAEERLTRAESRYRTVADFTHDWEYWETPEFRLEYCSPSCERITGYSAREFVANPRLVQQIVFGEDADLWQKHLDAALGAPRAGVIEFRIRRKDGSIRWVEHAWQPVVGEHGELLGIRASNRDTTDRKEQQLQTQRLREELAHMARITTAGQLAAALAHELRQPLTGILCNVQAAERFLANPQPDIKEVREALGDIRSDGERAAGVIHGLRNLFKKAGNERKQLQLNELLLETLSLLKSEFLLKGVNLTVELAPDLPAVPGNRVELQQVALNLILNALEAMTDQATAARRFHVRTERTGPNQVCASFRDSGPGIPASQLPRLFEPFFTTKPGGMGMGLTICQSILEAHSGRLWAANNPDYGATFHFALPVPAEDTA